MTATLLFANVVRVYIPRHTGCQAGMDSRNGHTEDPGFIRWEITRRHRIRSLRSIHPTARHIEEVDFALFGLDLEIGRRRLVPLIEYGSYLIQPLVQAEAARALVRRAAGIFVNMDWKGHSRFKEVSGRDENVTHHMPSQRGRFRVEPLQGLARS